MYHFNTISYQDGMYEEPQMASARRKKTEPLPIDREKWERYQATRHHEKRAENDVQTSLRLPRAMHDALEAAADRNGIGIGGEIRRRVENTFVLGLGEPETSKLVAAVMQAAHQIDRAYGPWRTDPFAFAVFNVANSTLLAYYKPKGEPVQPSPEPGSLADTFFGPNASPETAGRAVAMAVLTASGE
jgi:hypothetical protein